VVFGSVLPNGQVSHLTALRSSTGWWHGWPGWVASVVVWDPYSHSRARVDSLIIKPGMRDVRSVGVRGGRSAPPPGPCRRVRYAWVWILYAPRVIVFTSGVHRLQVTVQLFKELPREGSFEKVRPT
jgi:hypothetical protein